MREVRLLRRRGVRRRASNAEGKFLADAGTRDAFGHAQLGGVAPVVAQLVKDELGYKYHWAVADYLQRAARHIASKVDVEQAYAVGKAAVELALKGQNSVMPTIVRTSQTSPTAGRSAWRRWTRSPTRRRCCPGTTSRRTASTSPPRAGATWLP